VAAVIRHALAEGWLLLRQRGAVSVVLALALAVPISLAGVGLSLHRWLGPVAAMSGQASVVAVLLHPRLDGEQRSNWISEEAKAHPEWVITEISREDLVERLERWFPYLEELVAGGDASLPPLVEIETTNRRAWRCWRAVQRCSRSVRVPPFSNSSAGLHAVLPGFSLR